MQLWLLLLKVYLVREDFNVLGEDQDLLIGQDKLAFLWLTLWRNNGYVIPYNVAIEVLFDQDDLFMERDEEGLLLDLINFCASEDA